MSFVGRPCDLLDETVILALGCGLDGEIFRFHAVLARETRHRLRRSRFRRTHDALLAVGLALRQPVGAQHEAPRRGIEDHGLVRDFELLEQQAQVRQRPRNHPVGDLFGADFEQERDAHCATSAAERACC